VTWRKGDAVPTERCYGWPRTCEHFDDLECYTAEQGRGFRLRMRIARFGDAVDLRLEAARHVLRGTGGRDNGKGVRAALRVARGVACALVGRIDHGYPDYAGHPLSWELASWDDRTFAGAEQTCWSATFAAVCTGRAWHLHVYEDSGP
jgi:hypothetical protein